MLFQTQNGLGYVRSKALPHTQCDAAACHVFHAVSMKNKTLHIYFNVALTLCATHKVN